MRPGQPAHRVRSALQHGGPTIRLAFQPQRPQPTPHSNRRITPDELTGVTTSGGRPAGTAHPALTDQTGIPAGPAGLPRRPRPTVTTVTDQQTTRPTGLPGPRRTIGAITDQRTVEQRLGGRINHTQNVLTQRLRRGPGRPPAARRWPP